MAPPPWVWVRRTLAARWHCKPWEVDAASEREVYIEMRLMDLEADAAAWRAARAPRRTSG